MTNTRREFNQRTHNNQPMTGFTRWVRRRGSKDAAGAALARTPRPPRGEDPSAITTLRSHNLRVRGYFVRAPAWGPTSAGPLSEFTTNAQLRASNPHTCGKSLHSRSVDGELWATRGPSCTRSARTERVQSPFVQHQSTSRSLCHLTILRQLFSLLRMTRGTASS